MIDTLPFGRTGHQSSRIIFGAAALSAMKADRAARLLQTLLDSGINDLGGISPLTPDYVNPEAPWPHLGALARACADEGFELRPRLPIYEEFVNRPGFLDKNLAEPVRIHQRAVAESGSRNGKEGEAT